MKYVGSKAKYAKELLPIILNGRKEGQYYCEPFCGGCNLIDKVDGPRLANDVNYYVIEMFKAIQEGWEPPDSISAAEYCEILNNKHMFSPALVGFVAVGCSYAAKFEGGYARGDGRNYCAESKRNLLKQAEKIKDILFMCVDYKEMPLPKESITYCDIPYENTTKYKGIKFSHTEFWDWCRAKYNEGHRLFISEYNAPGDFRCVWEKKVNNSLTANTGAKTGVERLFIPNEQT